MVILAYKTFILLLVSFSFFFPLFCSASLLPHKNRPRSIWQMFRSRWQYWIAWPKIPFFHIFSLHICIFSKLSTLFFYLDISSFFDFSVVFRHMYHVAGGERLATACICLFQSFLTPPTHSHTFFRICRHSRLPCLLIHPNPQPPTSSFSPPFFFNSQILGSLLAFLFFHSLFHPVSSNTFHVF